MRKAVRCDPRIQAGVPCLAGTRVPTHAIWSYWESGVPIHIINGEYPALSHEQIWAAIHFEMRRRERRPLRITHRRALNTLNG